MSHAILKLLGPILPCQYTSYRLPAALGALLDDGVIYIYIYMYIVVVVVVVVGRLDLRPMGVQGDAGRPWMR